MDEDLKPMLTVVMPVYNAALYLKEAVDSILNQTFKDFELLIINDGSTDYSLQIIKSYDDKRIRLINNEVNCGIIKTRNKGLALSNGKYIAMMDADDVSLPTRFEKQVKYLEKNADVAVLSTKLVLISEKGEEQGYWPEDFRTTTASQINNTLPVSNCIGQPTVMMRADIVKPIGYNNAFLHNEDWGLWLNIISNGFVIAKLNEVLLKYRVHSSSTTVNANTKGVEKKIIRFKSAYLKQNFCKLKHTDYKILSSLFNDTIKYVAPTIYKIVTKLYKVNPLKLIQQYATVRKQLSEINCEVSHVFFFPYYHIGGAEKVHASILETMSDKKPIVFITDISSGNGLLNDFKKSATIIDVNLLISIGPFNRWITKKVKTLCENKRDIVLFGCNSVFFYILIPMLPKQTQCIDLIHAFVHQFEDGPEKWSLPVVPNLTKRVIISQNTKHDFERIYLKNGIDLKYLDRIVCIPNFVEPKKYVQREIKENINIIYVGRGSEEKRIYLISKAAKLAAQTKLPVTFHFVGDVKDAIPMEDLSYCKLYGEITDPQQMDEHYNNAHLLLITSSREGFPMVIMEGMMHGVVPIATNVGGISEHVRNRETGVLIDSVDENEIVNQIIGAIKYFVENKTEWKKMSENAFLYANTNFSKEAFFQSYKKLLN